MESVRRVQYALSTKMKLTPYVFPRYCGVFNNERRTKVVIQIIMTKKVNGYVNIIAVCLKMVLNRDDGSR